MKILYLVTMAIPFLFEHDFAALVSMLSKPAMLLQLLFVKDLLAEVFGFNNFKAFNSNIGFFAMFITIYYPCHQPKSVELKDSLAKTKANKCNNLVKCNEHMSDWLG